LHHITSFGPTDFRVPTAFSGRSDGFTRVAHLDRSSGAVHTGLGTCNLAAGGWIDAHLHTFEEFFFVLSGQPAMTLDGRSYQLAENDCGFIAVGATHAWRNAGEQPARWVELQTPIPRERPQDTFFVEHESLSDAEPLDVLDPRTRSFFRWHSSQMDLDTVRHRQAPDAPEMSSNLGSALHAYSGIALKMLIDERHGAHLGNLFMVDYEPGTVLHPHDHPLEEAFYMLDGEVAYMADADEYLLRPGDVALAGVGCVHAFENRSDHRARWLETRSPLPPMHHSYRFERDWNRLAERSGSS
jgi:quercetin dioxygenase-like cupin family protein